MEDGKKCHTFGSWREFMATLPNMNEQQLAEAINYEVSTYRREKFITRMHQRYSRLRVDRERKQLLNQEILL